MATYKPVSTTNGYWVAFAETFIYDNGFESGLSQMCDPVYADGRKYFDLSAIPLGLTIGGHTCVKRRIWQYVDFAGPFFGGTFQSQQLGPFGALSQGVGGQSKSVSVYCDINDNTTQAFTASSDPTQVTATASVATVQNASVFGQLQALPNVAQPPGPTAPISSIVMEPIVGQYLGFDPAYDAIVGTAVPNNTNTDFGGQDFFTASRAFRYSWIYANGVESQWSAPVSGDQVSKLGSGLTFDKAEFSNLIVSATTGLPAAVMPNFIGLQPGPTINNVPVIGMVIYCAFGVGFDTNSAFMWQPGNYIGCVIVPTGTPAATGYQPAFYNTCGSATQLSSSPSSSSSTSTVNSGQVPTWPWPDGPSLETDPPDDLTDDNPDLIAEDTSQRIEQQLDLTQVRNRIHVQGAGTTMAVAGNPGDLTLSVSDVTPFPSGTGNIYVDGLILQFSGVVLTSLSGTAGTIQLTAGLPRAVASGATVCNYLRVDDPKSQAALGAVEFDVNGNPTDGVHEYTVQDGTLADTFSMYMAANAQLEVYSNPVVTILYATRDPKSKVGQFVTVNMSSPPITGTFLIQSVKVDQVHDESDQLSPRYTVTACSAKFTLDDLLAQITNTPASGGGASGGGSSVATASQASTLGQTQVNFPTITSQLDGISTEEGSILYRGATAWQALAPGTAGYVLSTGGLGGVPSWIPPAAVTGVVLSGTGSPQGVQAATLGALYQQTDTGDYWIKRDGGSTAYGWYAIPQPGAGNAGGKLWSSWSISHAVATSGVNPFLGSGDGFLMSTAGANMLSNTNVTTGSIVIVSGKLYATATSSTTTGTTMYIATGASGTTEEKFLDDNFDITVEFLTGSSVASIRLWPIVISSTAMLNNANWSTAGNTIGIRFDSTSDSVFTGLTSTASTTSTVAITGAAVTANTVYRVRIRFIRQGGTPTAYFSVNGGTEVSLTSNIPATGSTYAIWIGATQLSAAAVSFGVRAIGATWG